MTIKLIGAGFGRTGTTSLKAALEELGFPCYHMQKVFFNPVHVPLWLRAASGEASEWNVEDWEEIFARYQATVDWPGCSFYQELMSVYPEAKVLLSIRDPERWYESTYATIYQIPTSLLTRLLKLLLPHIRGAYRVVDALVWHGPFANRFEERNFAIDVFNKHNESVKAAVPSERLLVYEVQEGWEPLCNFLGVPIPDKPFPHLNDKKLMQRAMRYGPAVIIGILVGLLGLFAWLISLAL